MKHLPKFIALIALAVAVFLTSCTSSSLSQEDIEFIKLLKDPSVKDVNKSIELKLDPVDPGQFEPRGIINLVAYNHSNNSIKFSPGSNVQIFLFREDGGKWEAIENAVEYYGDGRLIEPRGIELDFNTVTIRPVYEENGKEQRIRVAVTGYVVIAGQTTDEAVAAFVDFKVKP